MPAHFFLCPTPRPDVAVGDGCACRLRSQPRAYHASRRARGARDRVARCSVSSLAGSPFLPLRTTPSLSLHSAACVLFCMGSRSHRFASFACRRSSSTSPRQPFRLLPLCGVICRLWPPVGGRGMMTIVWCHEMIRWWALIVAADFRRKGSAAPWAARSGFVMAQNLHPCGLYSGP